MSRVFTVELPGAAGGPPERIPVLPKQARPGSAAQRTDHAALAQAC
jgi:hypothetical protein